ncbi:hypothetical protein MMC20_001695 [Loxospora ochrophaea]|nr:hypothetical protein [Loxospora ochrophaea]
MATGVTTAQTNGSATADQEQYHILEYEKILKLRDQIFAGTHPHLKIALPASSKVIPRAVESPSVPASSVPNGVAATSRAPNGKDPSYSSVSQFSVSHSTPSFHKIANEKRTSAPGTSSALDPIFLTKSEDLVRAELRLERQRIERALEEQVQQRRLVSKHRTSDLEAVPDFDITDVLAKAQELVKPIASHENIGANGIASSSDTFDENTYYSSQVNDSTTEDTEEQSKWRSKPCKYFFDGKCRKGDACGFSHDPAFKQKLQGLGSSVADHDTFDADSNKRKQDQGSLRRATRDGNKIHHSPGQVDRDTEPETRRHNNNQVERPEAFYDGPPHGIRIPLSLCEKTPYLPRTAGETPFDQRNVSRVVSGDQDTRRDFDHRGPRAPLRNPQPPSGLRHEVPPSPSPNDGRVVRNHITSPLAPQPARVSPLAVSRVPRMAQTHPQRIEMDSHMSGMSGTHSGDVQPSPDNHLPAVRTRKRRREPDHFEETRNVVARRRTRSPPEPYIKAEPLSPPPFTQLSDPRQVGQYHRPIDMSSPHERERQAYRRRAIDQPAGAFLDRAEDPGIPIARRVISRAGQHYEVEEEPSLRRIVSERNPRRVLSQVYSPSTSAAHLQMPREASQSYIVPIDRNLSRQPRASVQPPRVVSTRSLSPPLRRVPYTPVRQEAIPMAPPIRRIVVDQYGNEYYEAPLSTDRRASVVPVSHRQSHPRGHIEQLPPTASARQSHFPEAYEQRVYAPSTAMAGPTSPRFVEYYPATGAEHTESRPKAYEPQEELYRDRDGLVRVIEYPEERQPTRYEEVLRPREQFSRMPSVHPGSTQYASPRGPLARMQSVRPEPSRVVSLGGARDVVRAATRQSSVRVDDGLVRPSGYVSAERPRYEYVRDHGLVGDEAHEQMVGGRRVLHRL